MFAPQVSSRALRVRQICGATLLLALAGAAPLARASWPASQQQYSIYRLGLYGPTYTTPTGTQYSTFSSVNAAGQFVGTSTRYTAGGTSNGQDAWATIGTSTVQIGLTGGSYLGSGGKQYSTPQFATTDNRLTQTSAGQIVGYSERYLGLNSFNGADVWVFNGVSTVQIGLLGFTYSGGSGFRYSAGAGQTQAGQVIGYTERFSAGIDNGQDAWVYTGGTTTLIGFTDAAHTTSSGFRSAAPTIQNESGLIAGSSRRFNAGGNVIGNDAWAYIGGATIPIGLSGGVYTGSQGAQNSAPYLITSSGLIGGVSDRYTGVNTDNGRDAWIRIGATTQQLGLLGGPYTGSSGYQYSEILSGAAFQENGDHLLGFSRRISGASTLNGQDAWVWNAGVTTQIGFSGPGYIRSSGYQNSVPIARNTAGHVTGHTNRWDAASNDAGQDAWVFDGSSTILIGLTTGANTGSAGYRSSEPLFQNQSGQVVGTSVRFTGVSTTNGQDAWVWNGASTQPIGLTTAQHTGSGGYRNTNPISQNESGQVVGTSQRFLGVSVNNGQNAWAWNGASTVQIGLTAPTNTGSSGYQFSDITAQNASGQVVGLSRRITGVSNNNGTDAWYFDPATGVTSAIIASVRSDGYANAAPYLLSDDGFLLGQYLLFPGGVGAGNPHAFIFRPDLGFSDLGDLVAGGLSASGWSTLTQPQFASLRSLIAGYGLVPGQTDGRSAFVMVPSPGLAACLTPVALLWRNRRRASR